MAENLPSSSMKWKSKKKTMWVFDFKFQKCGKISSIINLLFLKNDTLHFVSTYYTYLLLWALNTKWTYVSKVKYSVAALWRVFERRLTVSLINVHKSKMWGHQTYEHICTCARFLSCICVLDKFITFCTFIFRKLFSQH